MDPKSLYISSRAYLQKVTWISRGPDPASEWIYFGLREQTKKDLLERTLKALFEEGEIYLVIDRHLSMRSSLASAIEKIVEKTPEALSGIFLWDEEFRTVLEIQSTGVFRYGVRRDP